MNVRERIALLTFGPVSVYINLSHSCKYLTFDPSFGGLNAGLVEYHILNAGWRHTDPLLGPGVAPRIQWNNIIMAIAIRSCFIIFYFTPSGSGQ